MKTLIWQITVSACLIVTQKINTNTLTTMKCGKMHNACWRQLWMIWNWLLWSWRWSSLLRTKIDIQVKTALGKEETLSTIQLDFLLPERFDLKYVGADGEEHRPVMIHRGVISTMERFTAILIENYKGAFPNMALHHIKWPSSLFLTKTRGLRMGSG